MDFSGNFDLAVIGAGPAGCSCAVTAARAGKRVLLLERGSLPRHKVCGEFVSAEALGLLESLLPGSDLLAQAPRIWNARVYIDAELVRTRLDPPGASVTRYDLDHRLWLAAQGEGVVCHARVTVTGIRRQGDGFVLDMHGGHITVPAVVNCTGRWSNLSDWHEEIQREKFIGLKAHFADEQECDSVDLYFFEGGYCGVQPIGDGRVNVAAMVQADVARTIEQVFMHHALLMERSRKWEAATETVSTAPLIFRDPQPVANGVLQAGDAAGFIDPFVGDGISMALHSGRMAAEAVISGGGAEQYQREYDERLMPAFVSAERIRAMLAVPSAVRRPFLRLLRVKPLAELLVRATRVRI